MVNYKLYCLIAILILSIPTLAYVAVGVYVPEAT